MYSYTEKAMRDTWKILGGDDNAPLWEILAGVPGRVFQLIAANNQEPIRRYIRLELPNEMPEYRFKVLKDPRVQWRRIEQYHDRPAEYFELIYIPHKQVGRNTWIYQFERIAE